MTDDGKIPADELREVKLGSEFTSQRGGAWSTAGVSLVLVGEA